MAASNKSRYERLIEKIFIDRYNAGDDSIPFKREDLESAAKDLEIELPKNLGDVLYAFRYRRRLPQAVLDTQPPDKEWIIRGTGHATYVFQLIEIMSIAPNTELIAVKIPDSTPEIVAAHALSDEQALLAKVRYNRLVDLFLGITAYSLQNHLRTSVAKVGQIEIDELYVGIDRNGRQYVIPVQAKGGTDRLSTVQLEQDIGFCRERYPLLKCQPVAAQFMENDQIALFEFELRGEAVKVVDEKHYLLVTKDKISEEDLRTYSQ